MNTQTLQIRKSPVMFTFVAIAILTGNASGQNIGNNSGNGLWQASGPNTIFTNRYVKINNSLLVHDKVTTDILHINRWLQLGNSTFFFVPNVGPFPLTDHIRSDNGRIAIMGGDSTTYNVNIKLGVGTTEPGYTLDVNDDVNVTPSAANHGYRIGGAVVLQKPWFHNIFVGESAGINNISSPSEGYNNSFLGYNTGSTNITGSNNTYLGYMADGTADLTNATVIGSEAIVKNSDNMILGNNRVRVGLGLSGESTGPQNNLEIFL